MTTREELLARGVNRLAVFCEANDLGRPEVEVVPLSRWRVDACGYYRSGVIRVCLERCARPGTGGRSWSWPGYPVDRTPHGVVLHELGHYVDVRLGDRVDRVDRYRSDLSTRIRRAAREPAITGYAPNAAEWFAEMIKLFAVNPDLLRLTRPRTYDLLLDAGLVPPMTARWRDVLVGEGAPDRTIRAAANRVARAARC